MEDVFFFDLGELDHGTLEHTVSEANLIVPSRKTSPGISFADLARPEFIASFKRGGCRGGKVRRSQESRLPH